MRAMVNRPISSFFPKQDIKLGPSLLEVENLASGERFADVSFDVRAGEIYGIAGLVGAGRTEILKTIFGVAADDRGPHSRRRQGLHSAFRAPLDSRRDGADAGRPKG